MTRPALVHTYPQWEPPEDDPSAPPEEWHNVQRGLMRIVRNRRRARLLERRGVPLWTHGPKCWLWFVESSHGNK